MHYWMIVLEELSLPIVERGCRVEEQVSEEEFSKLLVGFARKTGEKRLWIDCTLPLRERAFEEARHLMTSLQQ